jgi:hypothetical protein
MALLVDEVLGHVRRITWDGINIAFSTDNEVDYGSDTKDIAHQDIAPGSLGAGIKKKRVVNRTISATCKAYLKEGAAGIGNLTTFLTAWKNGAEELIRMGNVISGNHYTEFSGVVTSVKEVAKEGDYATVDIKFDGTSDITMGVTT